MAVNRASLVAAFVWLGFGCGADTTIAATGEGSGDEDSSEAGSGSNGSDAGDTGDSDAGDPGDAEPECERLIQVGNPSRWAWATAFGDHVVATTFPLTLIGDGTNWATHYAAVKSVLAGSEGVVGFSLSDEAVYWDGAAWSTLSAPGHVSRFSRGLDGRIWWAYHQPESPEADTPDSPRLFFYADGGLVEYPFPRLPPPPPPAPPQPPFPEEYNRWGIRAVSSDTSRVLVVLTSISGSGMVAEQVDGGLWTLMDWADWGPAELNSPLPGLLLVRIDDQGAVFVAWGSTLARRDPETGAWVTREFPLEEAEESLYPLAGGGILIDPQEGNLLYRWDGVGEIEALEFPGPISVFGTDPLYAVNDAMQVDPRIFRVNLDPSPSLTTVLDPGPAWPTGDGPSSTGSSGLEATSAGLIRWTEGEPEWVSDQAFDDIWVEPGEPGWGLIQTDSRSELWRIDDGAETFVVKTPPGVVLEDVWVRGSEEAWAVGHRPATPEELEGGPTRGVVWYYDGQQWAEADSPSDALAHYAIAGEPEPGGLVFMVSDRNDEWPTIHRLEGGAWTAVGYLNWSSGAGSELVVVGDDVLVFRGVLYSRSNGWNHASNNWPGAPDHATAVTSDGHGGAWVKGSSGDRLLYHYDGTSWRSFDLAVDDHDEDDPSYASSLIATKDGVVLRGGDGYWDMYFPRACVYDQVAPP